MSVPKPQKKEKPPEGQAVQVNFDVSIVPHQTDNAPVSGKRRGKFSQAFMEWRLYIPVVIETTEGGNRHDG